MSDITKKPGKKGGSYNPTLTVIERPASVETQDISSWKDAVNAAKRGRPLQLLRLYENILSDGLLSRAIDKRIEAITNAELVFLDKNNERVVDLDMLIDSPKFEYLIREILQSKFWGFSVIDIISSEPFDVYSCPRRNVNLENRNIVKEEGDSVGFPYEGVPYIIEVRDIDPLGALYKAAPYVLYKRGGFGDWSQFIELFGMPFRVGKYSSYDQTSRNELIRAMKESGGAGWAVVPKETEFEWIENKASGNGDLYLSFIDRCDKEMLIAILGNTMTTMEGSSRAQSDTHKEVEEGLNKSDRRFVQRILNRDVLPILEAAGYPVAGGFFSFTEAGEVLTTKDKVTLAKDLIDLGLPVADDYLYEVSGVPKPEGGAAVSTARKPAEGEGGTESGKGKTEKGKGKKEDGKGKTEDGKPDDVKNSDSFFSRLAGFFVEALGRRAPLKF